MEIHGYSWIYEAGARRPRVVIDISRPSRTLDMKGLSKDKTPRSREGECESESDARAPQGQNVVMVPWRQGVVSQGCTVKCTVCTSDDTNWHEMRRIRPFFGPFTLTWADDRGRSWTCSSLDD